MQQHPPQGPNQTTAKTPKLTQLDFAEERNDEKGQKLQINHKLKEKNSIYSWNESQASKAARMVH